MMDLFVRERGQALTVRFAEPLRKRAAENNPTRGR
jgi:hypothetical protein